MRRPTPVPDALPRTDAAMTEAGLKGPGAGDRRGPPGEGPRGEGQSILALDNIRLELPVAGVGSRVLAAAVDYLALWILLAVWVVVGIFVAGELDRGWAVALTVAGIFVLDHGYFIVSEVALQGRTLGKKALRIRVVGRDGGRASSGSLVVRNLLRVVDLIVGVLLMAADPWSRRLGDRLAGTLVVHETPAVQERKTTPEAEVSWVPAGWSAEEVAVAEALLRRRGELEPARARRLARRVLGWIEQDAPHRLEGADPESDPLVTLEGLLTRATERSGAGEPGGGTDRTEPRPRQTPEPAEPQEEGRG